MIVIKIPTEGTNRINVYDNEKLIFHVERKKYLFTGISEFYINQEKKAVIKSYSFSIKIKLQNFDYKITKISDFPYYTTFLVNNNKILIIDNPLSFIYPCFYSKIYWNGRLIANIKLKRVLDIEGVTLIIDFKTEKEEIKYYSLITYLMTCLHTNI